MASILDRLHGLIIYKPEDVINAVIEHEIRGSKKKGGYTNDPKDPGGETKWGISKRRYPSLNIKNLTRDDAIRLYKKDYWERYKVRRIPDKFKYVYMDMLVNMGPGKAARILQRGANGVIDPPLVIDGGIGPKTLKALKNRKVDIGKIRSARIYAYCMMISRKPKLIRFLEGWIERTLSV